MNSLLKVGDKFISAKLGEMLHGEIARDESGEPYVDFAKLHTEDYPELTTVSWKETKEGGWYRDRQAAISTKATNSYLLAAQWIVIKTDFTGGTVHGSYDVYPNGHWVLAQRVGGSETVHFYQSGCFRGMLLPQDIQEA